MHELEYKYTIKHLYLQQNDMLLVYYIESYR